MTDDHKTLVERLRTMAQYSDKANRDIEREAAAAIESLSERLDIAAEYGAAEYNRAERAEADAARYREIACFERQRMEVRNEYLVKTLVAIHSLLHPKDVQHGDKVMRFHYPENLSASEILRALSERIRAIPEELVAARKESA